ncbi:hypothetical protein CYMTET_46628 [Cymbomonas tetramitiformis]|uniref:TPM domain-containing protein n=1 Tax=Cymbomonas tetramitiformis TaxID=36881 RepID=A0AAE0BVU2_9CHLO|nr:hypothetical protein CYMTET_46628 [Cymbomonas tetramitiformis]
MHYQDKETLRSRIAGTVLAVGLTLGSANVAQARLEGVNNPDLLPAEFTTVIDVSGVLTSGEQVRMAERITNLEKDTGIKLRVLMQNYPNTPGLAIREYWGVDDDSVIFVADPNFGNILNFNIGSNVDLAVPPNFWTRLSGRFGTKKYWTENGQDVAVVNTVAAIDNCLREPIGVGQCTNIQGVLGH